MEPSTPNAAFGLYPDAFLPDDVDAPLPLRLPPHRTPTAATPRNRFAQPNSLRHSALPFASPSPEPATPAAATPAVAFNPDDFFVSPPTHSDPRHFSARFTPELKRRLFGASDAFIATPGQPSNPGSLQHTPLRALGLSLDNSASAPSTLLAARKKRARPSSAASPALTPFMSPSRPQAPAAPPLPVLPSPPPLPSPTAMMSSSLATTHKPKHPPAPLAAPALPGTPFTPPTETPPSKCSCKASRCLKLYCPCFASSGFCADGCTCKNCQNSQRACVAVHQARQTVLSRDPRAFEPKVRNSPATVEGSGDIHSKGCNCRKGCAKNYCVCRELGVSCGPRCTCSGPSGCLNGKSDALEDGQLKGKVEQIIGISVARVGPSPARFSAGLPPTNPGRKRGQSSASAGVKQERKRQKVTPKPRVEATAALPIYTPAGAPQEPDPIDGVTPVHNTMGNSTPNRMSVSPPPLPVVHTSQICSPIFPLLDLSLSPDSSMQVKPLVVGLKEGQEDVAQDIISVLGLGGKNDPMGLGQSPAASQIADPSRAKPLCDEKMDKTGLTHGEKAVDVLQSPLSGTRDGDAGKHRGVSFSLFSADEDVNMGRSVHQFRSSGGTQLAKRSGYNESIVSLVFGSGIKHVSAERANLQRGTNTGVQVSGDDKENRAPERSFGVTGVKSSSAVLPTRATTSIDEECAESNTHTPEHAVKMVKIPGGLDFATSPATATKDLTPTSACKDGNDVGKQFGREEVIEGLRLPRILRVKMGSGRALQFNL